MFMLCPGEHCPGVSDTIPETIGICGGGGSIAKTDVATVIPAIKPETFMAAIQGLRLFQI